MPIILKYFVDLMTYTLLWKWQPISAWLKSTIEWWVKKNNISNNPRPLYLYRNRSLKWMQDRNQKNKQNKHLTVRNVLKCGSFLLMYSKTMHSFRQCILNQHLKPVEIPYWSLNIPCVCQEKSQSQTGKKQILSA